MKRLAVILLVGITFFAGCRKEEGLYCEVHLTVELPSGASIRSLATDPSLEGNYFRNLNTGENYGIPAFLMGEDKVRVLRGLYLLSFDGRATLSDGTVCRVRSVEHATLRDALDCSGTEADVKLTLILLP